MTLPTSFSAAPFDEEKILALTAGEDCWHYTGASGLLGIIQRSELWASSASLALNDSSELVYGRELFASAWASMRAEYTPYERQLGDVSTAGPLVEEQAANVFVLSASKSGDSLNQWMHYGSQQGYSIRFDPTVALRGVVRDESNASAVTWREVIYDDQRQRRLVKQVVSDLVTKRSRFAPEVNQILIAATITQLKHPAFADEREVRATVTLSRHTSSSFREARGKIVPYVALAAKGAKGASALLPIVEVRCGPGVDPRGALVLRRLLDSYGYNAVTISQSTIPLLP